MAEVTRSPSLPSTADATPYVPVSWAAVAALAVAGLFALLLLAFGMTAFTNKKPLLMEELLVLPVIAVVLSFAARRMIRNSEGTRTGEKLTNAAWWTALILGLCYVAYLFAIDFAIRRDAREATDAWMGFVKNGTDKDIGLAFYRTLPPGAQQGVSPENTPELQLRYRDEMLVFRNSDLLKLAQRNLGEVEYATTAVAWVYKPGAIESTVSGTVKCPEGTFPITISLKGTESTSTAEGGTGGRRWTINRPQGGGFIDQTKATRTQYGWLVLFLELDGGGFGKSFVSHTVAAGPPGHPYLYRGFVVQNGDRLGWGAVATDQLPMHLAFAAPAHLLGNASYTDYLANHFYRGRNGTDPTPEQKTRFLFSWNTFGIRPAGDKLKDGSGGPLDKEDVITITDAAVQVRVPIEIPLPATGGKHEVARGRVVVESTDPQLLAEVKKLKTSAGSDPGSSSPPENLARKVPWRVARIESDMAPVNIIPPSGRGGPGGPGGPDGMPGGLGGPKG